MKDTKTEETIYIWGVNDPKLPPVVDRPRDSAYYKDFLPSIKEHGQLSPIMMGKLGKEWVLVYGRARLMACRDAEIPTVKVIVRKLESIDEVAILRIAENHARSSNIVADYLSIRDTLLQTLSYEEAGTKIGMSANDVKALDNMFGTVPNDVLQGVIQGNVSVSTAKAVGKLTPSLRGKASKVLAENHKLTGKDLHDMKDVLKEEVIGGMKELLNEAVTFKQDVFNRSQLVTIRNIFVSQGLDAGLKALNELLGE